MVEWKIEWWYRLSWECCTSTIDFAYDKEYGSLGRMMSNRKHEANSVGGVMSHDSVRSEKLLPSSRHQEFTVTQSLRPLEEPHIAITPSPKNTYWP
jgi:hypothetical protein